MVKFEKASKYADVDIMMPRRATANSAGYDLFAAEDIVIPPLDFLHTKIQDKVFEGQGKKDDYFSFTNPLTLDSLAQLTKELKAKPTLVPTGVKCKMGHDQYLQLSVRSSLPLKHWLIMANSPGIVDSDYYGNMDNDGLIYVQLINLSPFAISIKKDDCIAQGIILRYDKTDDDEASDVRCGGFGSTSR